MGFMGILCKGRHYGLAGIVCGFNPDWRAWLAGMRASFSGRAGIVQRLAGMVWRASSTDTGGHQAGGHGLGEGEHCSLVDLFGLA